MKRFLKDYELSNKDVIISALNAGWIGHSFRDYENLLSNANIKGELDVVFSANENERDRMITSYSEIETWIEKIK